MQVCGFWRWIDGLRASLFSGRALRALRTTLNSAREAQEAENGGQCDHHDGNHVCTPLSRRMQRRGCINCTHGTKSRKFLSGSIEMN